MRFPVDVTPASFAALLDAPTRRVTSRVTVLDRNERPIGSTVPASSGSVTVDTDADVTRSCEVRAIDPGRKLGFDADSPGDGALYADRFIQVDYGVGDPTGDTAWTPIFRGPVIRYERSHPEVSISAQGKESLALAPNLPMFKGQALVIGRGVRLDAAVGRIAAAMGERFTSVPVLKRSIGERISIGRTKEPWRVLRRLCRDNGLQAFYDGAGVLRVRSTPAKPVWRFAEEVLTWPKVTYDLGGDFRNIVRVVGTVRSGQHGSPPHHTAEPPPADPLSPRSLARNGVPRYVAEYIEIEGHEDRQCRTVAERELRRRMRQAVSVEFESLTVPGLEEGDPCVVVLPAGTGEVGFSARSFGLGLGTDQMTLGFSKKVRLRSLT